MVIESITLCLLVRDNEAEIIGRLKPLIRAFKNVLVVDTGSRDATPKILRSMGVTVLEKSFNDNFSELRNLYLDHVKTNWVLSLDSDEAIRLNDLPKLELLTSNAPKLTWAFRFPIALYQDSSNDLQFVTPLQDQRLDPEHPGAMIESRIVCFRVHPKIRYRGIVHESIFKSILECKRKVSEAPLLIHNYGQPSSFNSVKLKQNKSKNEGYFKLLRHQVLLTPIEPKPHYELGLCYLENGKLKKAGSCFQRAVELKPNLFEAWFHLGTLYAKLGYKEKALACMGLAIQDKHWEGLCAYNMAVIYEDYREYKQAYAYYNRSFERLQNKDKVIWSIIRLIDHWNKHSLGLKWFDLLEKMSPPDRSFWFYRGIFHAKNGEPQNARKSFQEALKIDPRHIPSWINLSTMYNRLGNPRECLKCLKQILQIDPNHDQSKKMLLSLSKMLKTESSRGHTKVRPSAQTKFIPIEYP